MNILHHPEPTYFYSQSSRAIRRIGTASNRRRVPARIMASTGANHGVKFAVNRRESLRHIRRGAVPSCLPSALERLAGPRPRFAKALRPRLHGLQHHDLALLPPAVALHPQGELVDAASVAGVGPRIGGPPGSAPLSTKPIGDGGSLVALHEAWHHRNAAQDILDVADV